MEKKAKISRNESINPMQLASVVSAKVNICDVFLEESTIKRSNQESRPERISFSTSVSTHLNEETKLITVKAKLAVFPLLDKERDKEEDAFRIDATYIIIYQVTDIDGVKNENLEAFGKLNGLFNVWPYWREYVQTTTTRMGYPPLTLPVFRVLPQKAKDGTEAQKAT